MACGRRVSASYKTLTSHLTAEEFNSLSNFSRAAVEEGEGDGGFESGKGGGGGGGGAGAKCGAEA
eukprot:9406281-Pyramimonas_sp.AAC.1